MTLLVERYNYQPISRESVDGRRLYATPDGSRVPSVTTILDKTKPEEAKAALAAWKKRVGVEKAQQITTEAASRGTRMHSYLENYVKDGVLKEPGTNPYSKISHAMAQTIIDSGLGNVNEFWGMEVPLYHAGLYAGTTDCIGIWKNKEAIIDFKQTNKPKKREWIDDYFLQLAAYAEAHNNMHGTKIETGVICMCIQPEVDSATLQILKPPVYQEFVLEFENYKSSCNKWWDRVEEYYANYG